MAIKKAPEIDKALEKYILGSADDEDLKIVIAWLSEHPERKKQLFLKKDLWDAASIGADNLSDIESREWVRLEQKILRQIRIKDLQRSIVRYAAIVIFTFGIGWFSHYVYSSRVLSDSDSEWQQVEANKGQLKELFLADGTHVWLNADTRISFPSNFSEKNRRVTLRGEAFFDVISDPKRPFIVETGNHKVKVTGTQFNVCEYPESGIIETTLVEGRVQIITGNVIKDLMPGQQSSFNTSTATIRINERDFKIYTAWKDGRYEFKNIPIGKLFQIVERWWDVEIRCSDENIMSERMSGVLKRHKPMEQLFPLIDQLVPIRYQIQDDIIYVDAE